MNIQSDRAKTIFKHTKDDKVFYSIGMSKKDVNGNYISGCMSCRFTKGVDIPDKSKILIHKGWVDFYLKDKITYPYLFISEFEIVDEKKEEVNEFDAMHTKTDYKEKEVQIDDNSLPF